MKSETRSWEREVRSRSSWLTFLLLCGYLIFCHGCHGEDVDDELSVPLPAARDGERPASAGWSKLNQPADAGRSPINAVLP